MIVNRIKPDNIIVFLRRKLGPQKLFIRDIPWRQRNTQIKEIERLSTLVVVHNFSQMFNPMCEREVFFKGIGDHLSHRAAANFDAMIVSQNREKTWFLCSARYTAACFIINDI